MPKSKTNVISNGLTPKTGATGYGKVVDSMRKEIRNNALNVNNSDTPESNNIVKTNIRRINQNEIKNIINIRKSKLAKAYLNHSIDRHPKYTLEIER